LGVTVLAAICSIGRTPFQDDRWFGSGSYDHERFKWVAHAAVPNRITAGRLAQFPVKDFEKTLIFLEKSLTGHRRSLVQVGENGPEAD
jgi:hypothetical protein